MSGIVFFNTKELEKIREFYITKLGMDLWLEQEDCIIMKHGNMLLGFCEREEKDQCGIITFVYHRREAVDRMYEKLKEFARAAPQENDRYQLYHFFAEDLEGRTVECQYFLHNIPEI